MEWKRALCEDGVADGDSLQEAEDGTYSALQENQLMFVLRHIFIIAFSFARRDTSNLWEERLVLRYILIMTFLAKCGTVLVSGGFCLLLLPELVMMKLPSDKDSLGYLRIGGFLIVFFGGLLVCSSCCLAQKRRNRDQKRLSVGVVLLAGLLSVVFATLENSIFIYLTGCSLSSFGYAAGNAIYTVAYDCIVLDLLLTLSRDPDYLLE